MPKGQQLTPKHIALLILAVIVVFWGIIKFYQAEARDDAIKYLHERQAKNEAQSSRTPATFVETAPSDQTDANKFKIFCYAIIEETKNIDTAYAPFADALAKFQLDVAYDRAAETIPFMMNHRRKLDKLQPPTLKNSNAQADARKALIAINSAYASKIIVIRSFKELQDANMPFTEITKDMVKYGDKYQKNLITGISLLYSAGMQVGLKKGELAALFNN